MSTVVQKLAASNHLTPTQVERIDQSVNEFMQKCSRDSRFYETALNKLGEGFMTDLGKNLVSVVGGAMALAASEAAIKGGVGLIVGMKEKKELRNAYSDMMKASPNLKQYGNTRTQAAFNTLSNFNPSYAKDPLVAGTFVQNAMEMDRIDIGTVNALVDSSSKLQKGIVPFELAPYMGVSQKMMADIGKKPQEPHPSQVKAWEAQAEAAKAGKPGPHPSQVKAWEAQAEAAKAGKPGPHPSQVKAWEGQAQKAESEGRRQSIKAQAELAAMRSRLGKDNAIAAAEIRKRDAIADKERAKAEFWRNQAAKNNP